MAVHFYRTDTAERLFKAVMDSKTVDVDVAVPEPQQPVQNVS